MSRVDIVIFGATGYTGRRAAMELARMAQRESLTWAVAGRSQDKLEALMLNIANVTGVDQSHVKIIVADVNDEESVLSMCKQARVVANCCGPYRRLGEVAVRAAIAARAHHVDVTGEPQFMEQMQLKYDAKAREAGVYVVSACGLDSVPNDMGVAFLQQHFPGTLNSVESYLTFSLPEEYQAEAKKYGTMHYGTWESLIYSLHHWEELAPLRKKLYPTKMPTFLPKLKPRPTIHRRSPKAPYSVPFLGADGSVVYRSQRALYEAHNTRPVQFRAYLTQDSWLAAVMGVLAAMLLYFATRLPALCRLLLKYPRVCSGGLVTPEGPTDRVVENQRFTVTLYGEGWGPGGLDGPCDTKLVAQVSGSNPGYGATVVALLHCALTVLRQRDRMPAPGGVLTTAVAFKDTDLIKNLNENGIKFEIIKNPDY